MLFIVIERLNGGDPWPVSERFARRGRGRMLPAGVVYHASWVDVAGTRCFQVLEAPQADALAPWMARWSDLIDVAVVPVLASAAFRRTVAPAPPG